VLQCISEQISRRAGIFRDRNEAYGSGAAHHNGKFDIDESGFWLGVCAEAAFAFEK